MKFYPYNIWSDYEYPQNLPPALNPDGDDLDTIIFNASHINYFPWL